MVNIKVGELSDNERISLIKAAKAALRKAGTPCIVFSWRGKRFHYGPTEFEQNGSPPGTYIISEGDGMIKRGDWILATKHPFPERTTDMSNDRSSKTFARVLESIDMSLRKVIDAEAATGKSALEIKVEDWVCRWAQQYFGVKDPTKHLQQMIMDYIEQCYHQKMIEEDHIAKRLQKMKGDRFRTMPHPSTTNRSGNTNDRH